MKGPRSIQEAITWAIGILAAVNATVAAVLILTSDPVNAAGPLDWLRAVGQESAPAAIYFIMAIFLARWADQRFEEQTAKEAAA